MKMLVTGFKHSKGEFNGNTYDYISLFCLSRLKASDAQRGSAGIDMRAESVLLDKLKKIEFNGPIACEVETEAVATGKGQFVETVVNITPLNQKPA